MSQYFLGQYLASLKIATLTFKYLSTLGIEVLLDENYPVFDDLSFEIELSTPEVIVPLLKTLSQTQAT